MGFRLLGAEKGMSIYKWAATGNPGNHWQFAWENLSKCGDVKSWNSSYWRPAKQVSKPRQVGGDKKSWNSGDWELG